MYDHLSRRNFLRAGGSTDAGLRALKGVVTDHRFETRK
jgi:hypothetical protein